LAASAQQYGVAIGKLGGYVNPGHTPAINGAREDFADLCERDHQADWHLRISD
jgi:hypothetical protein